MQPIATFWRERTVRMGSAISDQLLGRRHEERAGPTPSGATAPAAGEPILLIDDDSDLGRFLREYLAEQGFALDVVSTANECLQQLEARQYMLILLDILLPDLDGLELLRRVRSLRTTPVMIVSARDQDIDRIVGLELGADDYVVKPFNPRELVARIRAILRRTRFAYGSDDGREPPILVGDLAVDPATRRVKRGGISVDLTMTEFDLLLTLVRSVGRVVPRDDISRTVLGRRLLPEDRSIDVHVSNLRRKLGHYGSGEERIRTLRGVGYLYVVVSDMPPPGVLRA